MLESILLIVVTVIVVGIVGCVLVSPPRRNYMHTGPDPTTERPDLPHLDTDNLGGPWKYEDDTIGEIVECDNANPDALLLRMIYMPKYDS